MPSYSYGDILLLPFSYTDLTSEKRRPALVLLDSDDGDVLVARITSKNWDTPYDVPLEEWNETGLLIPSYIRLHKLIAIEKTHILKQFGSLSNTDKEAVRRKFVEMI